MTRLSLLIALVAAAGLSAQQTVSVRPAKDNTLIQTAAGDVSNAKGPLYAGRTRTAGLRRAAMQFDVASSLPTGARILAAELRLRVTKASNTSPTLFAIYRMTADWGEGSSATRGGGGAKATAGDATWTHRFWPAQRWTRAGGDYASRPASTQNLASVGSYTFPSTTQFVSDVQGWLDKPTTNFGFVLLGGESVPQTAKEIASREDASSSRRPELRITYAVVPTASVSSTGTGCTTPNGTLTHGATGRPTLGNQNYRLDAKAGPSSGIALLLFGTGLYTTPPPLNQSGCLLQLDLAGLFLIQPGAFDSSGVYSSPLPIPNDLNFAGLRLQSQVLGLAAPATFSSSNALTHLLGQ